MASLPWMRSCSNWGFLRELCECSLRPLRLSLLPLSANQENLTAEYAKKSRGVRREIQIEPPPLMHCEDTMLRKEDEQGN